MPKTFQASQPESGGKAIHTPPLRRTLGLLGLFSATLAHAQMGVENGPLPIPQNLTGQERVVVQVLGPTTPLLAKLLDSVPIGLDVHLDAFEVGDPGLGIATLLLRRLQLGHQSDCLVGPGDRLRQPGLGGGELRDLDQQVLSATLLPGLDVVGDLAQVGLERLGRLDQVDYF